MEKLVSHLTVVQYVLCPFLLITLWAVLYVRRFTAATLSSSRLILISLRHLLQVGAEHGFGFNTYTSSHGGTVGRFQSGCSTPIDTAHCDTLRTNRNDRYPPFHRSQFNSTRFQPREPYPETTCPYQRWPNPKCCCATAVVPKHRSSTIR